MEHHLRLATIITHFLDDQFSIGGHKFGFNGILGLLPISGDLFVAILSFYLVWVGVQMNLPKVKIAEMVFNVALNFFIGLVPVIGDFADFFHKANIKNLAILKSYEKKGVIEGEVIKE